MAYSVSCTPCKMNLSIDEIIFCTSCLRNEKLLNSIYIFFPLKFLKIFFNISILKFDADGAHNHLYERPLKLRRAAPETAATALRDDSFLAQTRISKMKRV